MFAHRVGMEENWKILTTLWGCVAKHEERNKTQAKDGNCQNYEFAAGRPTWNKKIIVKFILWLIST
jgi:hypothetical protein